MHHHHDHADAEEDMRVLPQERQRYIHNTRRDVVVPAHEPTSGGDTETSPRKLGLAFILNTPRPDSAPAPTVQHTVSTSPDGSLDLTQHLQISCTIKVVADPRRRGRTCRFDGCGNYIVHKGLCCRHGGGRKCSEQGCESTAKHGGRCWKHGGSVKCKIPACTSKAKTRGVCWAHGGGAKCRTGECAKVAITHGLCWAHGGGKRCIFDDCKRLAYERTHNFCLRHYDELQGVDYYEV